MQIKRIISFFLIFCLLTNQAVAVSLIRDAEIEHTLRIYANPIFKAAKVNPSAARLFIVQDNSLNAYVAGGINIFIHTGLIMAAKTPDVLIGVMAHETGHIAGGHLARGTEKMKNVQLGTIMTFVLGVAAAAASRKPEVASAVISGGQNSIMRNVLSYTRANEQAADQSAINILNKLRISAGGMMKMFEILRINERKRFGSIDPYMVTHPLTKERIEFVRNNIKKSNIPANQYPKSYDILHQRMVAKLYGFIQTPKRTLRKYPINDKSLPARLARAIAYYKMPNINKSLKEIDSLISESPNDPFFHELKGQILFENGRVRQSLSSYKAAAKLLPNSGLILADLGKVEIAQNLLSTLKSAIIHLEKSVLLDNSNSNAWRLLATAYGRTSNMPMSNLALAEEALLNGDSKIAIRMSSRAISSLKESTPAYRRALDIRNIATEIKHKKH